MGLSYGSPSGSFARFCTKRPIASLIPLVLLIISILGGFTPIVRVDPRSIKSIKVLMGQEYFPVTFAFDDGKASVPETALPILEGEKKTYGIDIPATAYIITDDVGTVPYMSKAQIVDLYNHGWDIGSHTATHADLPSLDEADLNKELVSSKGYLQGLGIDVRTISSPDGRYNALVLSQIAKYYSGHRSSDIGLNNYPPQNRYLIKSVFFEGAMKLGKIKNWVDQAFDQKKWLVVSFHNILDKSLISDPNTLLYTTDVGDFKSLSDYVAHKYVAYYASANTSDLTNSNFSK